MFSCLMVGVGNKAYTLNRNIQQKQILLFNTASGAVATCVLFVWGGIEKISTFSLLLGIAFGVITMLLCFSSFVCSMPCNADQWHTPF